MESWWKVKNLMSRVGGDTPELDIQKDDYPKRPSVVCGWLFLSPPMGSAKPKKS